MSRPALYVRLLGEPEIESSAGNHGFRPDKRYLLLAYLACQHDWVERVRLARLFWPEHDPPGARHNLRQLIKRLKSLPWQLEVETSSAPSGHGAGEARLRWLPATDLADLDAALAAGRWDDARALHRGPLLAGIRVDSDPAFDTWLANHRQAVEDRVRHAFMTRGAALTAAGEHGAATELFGHLVDAERYDEEALRAYMLAVASSGRSAAALAAYERFAARVRADFGLTPMAVTEELAQQIRSGDLRSTSPAAEAGVEQARHDGRTGRPGVLVGRELELSDVHRLLADPECRLVTITGPGGVGKSAVARQADHELGGNFADGSVYVTLDGAGASSLMASITAHVSPPGVPGGAVDPAAAIGARELLLVLDDLDAHHDEAVQLLDVLRRCPNLRILTTTRERLALEGEWLLPLEGLRSPSENATLAEVQASDAVRLFVTRAQRLRPAYFVTDDDAQEVARICRLVAGLPLALELAAAWTRVLPAAAIADEIAGGFDMLSGGSRGTADRHSSMRVCIEHSWRALSEAERRAWPSLTLFESPFDRAAAERVTGVALPLLAALVDKSILRSVAGRFSFHPLLRAYGLEHVDQEPSRRDSAREAHADHFLSAVTDANDRDGQERRTATDALANCLDDVSAAWRWAIAALGRHVPATRPPTAVAVTLWCRALSKLCDERAWYARAAALFEEASSELERASAPDELLGTVLAEQGWHEYRLGRTERAEAVVTKALDLLADHEESPSWRTASRTLGLVALQAGRFGDAAELFEKLLEAVERSPAASTTVGRRERANLTGDLGVAKQFSGDRHGAIAQYETQLELLRGVGDTARTVSALSNLGNVLRIVNRFDEAQATLEEGLRLATEERYETFKPSLNINLGVLHRQSGATEVARTHLEVAARLARESGRLPMVVLAVHQLGKLELDVGATEAARARFQDALDVAVGTANTTGTLDALAGLAWVAWRTGIEADALTLARVVHEHQAALHGTRKWAGELLALKPGADGAGRVSVTPPLDEAVTMARRLAVATEPR